MSSRDHVDSPEPLVGLMQGRLLPPIDGRIQAFPARDWMKEFPLARELGYQTIEFIFDGNPGDHPLMSSEGIESVRQMVQSTGILVESVCADYFMSHPLHAPSESQRDRSISLLKKLIANCASLGIRTIVLPCVDQSSLLGKDFARLLDPLSELYSDLKEVGSQLAIEADLGPAEFATLLEGTPEDCIGVNYDMGNSAALGYKPFDEFSAYGSRVTSVHVKDRKFEGTTVPLGSGDTDFDACFQQLLRFNYRGTFIVQGARGPDDLEVARHYLQFVRSTLRRVLNYGSSSSRSNSAD